MRDTVRDLEMDQPLRRIQDETTWEKIEALVKKMKDILGDDEEEKDEEGTGEVVQKSAAKLDKPMKPFTVQLDDPAGNSWIEFIGSMDDPKWTMRQYERTPEQNAAIGLGGGDEPAATVEAKHVGSAREVMDAGKKVDGEDDVVPNEEIYVFPGTCSSCSAPLDTMMKRVIIPYFKVCPFVSLAHASTHSFYDRIYSSCPPTALPAATATTKSNPAAPSPSSANASRSRSKTAKTSLETSSNPKLVVLRSPRSSWF